MIRSVNSSLILTLLLCSGVYIADCSFNDTYAPFAGIVDEGAFKTCYLLGGTVALFNPNAAQQGHKCTYTANVWTKDDKVAEDFCASNTPYPVIRELVKSMDGGKTQCGYLITLQCKNDWWQIDGLCYKAIGKFTFSDAKKFCEQLEHQDTEPKLAEFYSTTLGMFLEHMMFSEVWVTVPDITEYFVNGVGEAAVFVNDGAFKYDTKQGTLIMEKEDEKHPALCQYKPAITMAEVYRRAKEYEEIYPIYTQDSGINVVTSTYLTVHQASARKFDTNEIRERCNSLGKIINVESFPLAPVESEWNEIRSFLKEHRFYLTGAFKNDGCKLTDYRNYDVTNGKEVVIFPTGSSESVCNAFSFSFNENKRAPSMAGMRAPAICALHSYTLEMAPCESGWVPFDREGNNRFCHFVDNKNYYSFDKAKKVCLQKNAALTGFDSQAELNTVLPHTGGLGIYWLGGVLPCAVDCQPGFLASWEEGVARNTAFLNNHNHGGFWSGPNDDFISLCGRQLHSHFTGRWHDLQYICGKYAGFANKKIEKNMVAQ